MSIVYPYQSQYQKWMPWASGKPWNGIADIIKINTVWLVDTYRILYTNGTYTDYDVTNWIIWSDGTNWVWVSSVVLQSGTHAPWTTDTYRMTFTDSSFVDFTVYNGADGVGTGDVVWPVSVVDNRVVFFNWTTGKLIKDSWLTLSWTNTGDNSVNSLYSGLVSNATHTGDVTGDIALTIANDAVTNSKMANMATKTYKGRTTAATGDPEDVSVTTLKSDLSLNNVDNTSDATKNSAAVALTNKDISSSTNTYRAASLTVVGWVELATTAEINIGTDTTRAIPVDQFVASNRNVRYFDIYAIEKATDNAVGTNIIGSIECPFTGTITEIGAYVETAGVTGASVWDVNKNGTTIMTTNKLSIDSAEVSTRTAATAPTLTTTAITAGDLITIDTDSLSTTKPKGLHIRIWIRQS